MSDEPLTEYWQLYGGSGLVSGANTVDFVNERSLHSERVSRTADACVGGTYVFARSDGIRTIS